MNLTVRTLTAGLFPIWPPPRTPRITSSAPHCLTESIKFWSGRGEAGALVPRLAMNGSPRMAIQHLDVQDRRDCGLFRRRCPSR